MKKNDSRIPISAILDKEAFDKLHKMWVKEINEGKKSSKNMLLNKAIMAYEQKEK